VTAIFSCCGRYRYRLEREGSGEGSTAVIMVNPSTADETIDDHTIRKLRGFGERYEWGRIIVGNLFAWRATDVRELQFPADPIGPENAHHLAKMIHEADRIVFAWGPLSKQPARYRHLWRAVDTAAHYALKQPLSLGAPAKDGHPCHPLTLAYSRAPQPWIAP
jgi:hypothetical protein